MHVLIYYIYIKKHKSVDFNICSTFTPTHQKTVPRPNALLQMYKYLNVGVCFAIKVVSIVMFIFN